MFRIFRSNSKKGDKKKKGAKYISTDHLNGEVNSKPDGKSVEDTDMESVTLRKDRKDSIPIGINWITQPSRHSTMTRRSTNPDNERNQENPSTSSRVSQLTENSDINIKERDSSRHSTPNKVNSTNLDTDRNQENPSTPSRVSQLTENSDITINERDSINSKFSNTTPTENLLSNNKSNRRSQENPSTPNRVSQLTESSDINIKERDSINSKFSNTTSTDNLLPNNKSNRNSINCENTSNDKVNEDNFCNSIKVQTPLQGEIISNTNIIKQEINEYSSKIDNNTHDNKVFQDILELLLTKFNKFEENIMIEINCIKESQEKQEKRLQEIQNRQEEVKNTLTQVMSKQLSSSTDKQMKIDDKENLSESEKEYPDSIPVEKIKLLCLNNLPTIQEADINVEQVKTDLPETDLQSPSVSSSLMNTTVTSSVTTHTLEQSQTQQASTQSPESISDITDEKITIRESLSKSLPTQLPATPLTPCTSLTEAQQKAPSTMPVHHSVSNLEFLHTPVTTRNSAAVPSPFRSNNPPIKHSPPTKPKRLSLQIPMSSSPSHGLDDLPLRPLRRTIEWPEHSPFATHKTNVSSKPLKKVHDRDMRMFITITP